MRKTICFTRAKYDLVWVTTFLIWLVPLFTAYVLSVLEHFHFYLFDLSNAFENTHVEFH